MTGAERWASTGIPHPAGSLGIALHWTIVLPYLGRLPAWAERPFQAFPPARLGARNSSETATCSSNRSSLTPCWDLDQRGPRHLPGTVHRTGVRLPTRLAPRDSPSTAKPADVTRRVQAYEHLAGVLDRGTPSLLLTFDPGAIRPPRRSSGAGPQSPPRRRAHRPGLHFVQETTGPAIGQSPSPRGGSVIG